MTKVSVSVRICLLILLGIDVLKVVGRCWDIKLENIVERQVI